MEKLLRIESSIIPRMYNRKVMGIATRRTLVKRTRATSTIVLDART